MHLYQHLILINKQTKNISICADDFGITKKVNIAITNLAELNKISDISCIFVNNNHYDNNTIKKISSKVDFGLHITLTDFTPITNAQSLLNKDNKLINLKNGKSQNIKDYSGKVFLGFRLDDIGNQVAIKCIPLKNIKPK